MTRVKRAVNALKRRRNLLKKTKGYRFGRRSKERAAKDAWIHATAHAFRHRKAKKREYRALWNVRIGAGLPDDLSYSAFMGLLKKKRIGLDRKVLAAIAESNIDAFERIVTASRS